jgi:hypothetical protein
MAKRVRKRRKWKRERGREKERTGKSVKGKKASKLKSKNIEPKCPSERENKWKQKPSSLKKSHTLE